jgi:hypothetical protein
MAPKALLTAALIVVLARLALAAKAAEPPKATKSRFRTIFPGSS